MLEIDIRMDTDLRQRAVEVARKFTAAHGYPVKRTQIAGLLQIASNEPSLIARYAGNQKERAEKRKTGMRDTDTKAVQFQAEIDFWSMVVDVCAGKGAQHEWSLAQECEKAMPAELKNLVKPHPTDTGGREVYDRRMKEKKRREHQWNRDYYPGFFRQFAAEYLYRMPLERGNHHESD